VRSLRLLVGDGLERVGLKGPINQFRFRLMRPDWWVEAQPRNAFLRTLFQAGDLVFDIGANDGDVAEWYASLGARVVSVEPQPSCAEAARRHIERYSSITWVPMAAGAAIGHADIWIASEGSPISSMAEDWIDTVRSSRRFEGHDWRRKITVPVTTLDALIERYGCPVYCKIDVEGYERQVLQGLSRPIRSVSFEYTPENRGHATGCVGRLAELGEATFNVLSHHRWSYAWDGWLDAREAVRRLEDPDEVLSAGGDVYCRTDQRT
jgi:FkbM family methyltransferase